MSSEQERFYRVAERTERVLSGSVSKALGFGSAISGYKTLETAYNGQGIYAFGLGTLAALLFLGRKAYRKYFIE